MARKMKDSGIEWIGEIPEDWKVIPLKNICKEFYSGGTPTASNNSYYTTTEFGYPFINISDLTNNKYVEIVGKHITIEAAKSKNLKLIDNNYVLLAMYASTGTVSMLKLRSYISQAILAIKPGIKIEKEYLFYFLSSFKPYSEVYSRGTTQNNLNAEIIKNLKVPIPNIKKQLKITNFLNKKSNRIQKLMNKINKQIQTLEDYKKSVITEAVTKGLDKNVEMKDSGIEWIGEIPKHWKADRLKNIVNYNKYTLKETTNKSYRFKYVDIGSVEYGKGVLPLEVMNFEKAPSRARRIVKEGDIIISTVRTYLKAIAVIPKSDMPIIASTGFMTLRTKEIVDQEYLKYVVQSETFISEISSKSFGVNYPAINTTELINIKIVIPPKEERLKIISYLDKNTKLINKAIESKQKQLEILEEYKKSLIYEYVTGKKEVEDVGTI